MNASIPSSEAVQAALAAKVLRNFGELRFRARGGSMIPSIFPGDILVVKRESLCETLPGDIVLFHRENRLWAHRVVRVQDRGGRCAVITQGDALINEDAAVFASEFLGRVSAIIRDGLQFELPSRRELGQRLLGWVFRRSEFAARCFLWWHLLRTPFARQPPVSPNRIGAGIA